MRRRLRPIRRTGVNDRSVPVVTETEERPYEHGCSDGVNDRSVPVVTETDSRSAPRLAEYECQ